MLKRWLSVSLIVVLCGVLLVGFVPLGNCDVLTLSYSNLFSQANNVWVSAVNTDNLAVAVTGTGAYLSRLIMSVKDNTGTAAGSVYGVLISSTAGTIVETSVNTIDAASGLTGTLANCTFNFSNTTYLFNGVTYYVGIRSVLSAGQIATADENGGGQCYQHSPDLYLVTTTTPVYAIYTTGVYGGGNVGVENGLSLSIYGSPHFLVDTLCVPNAIHTCDQGYGYGFTGHLYNDWVENVTAGGVFNVTWIGFQYTLGYAYDPTRYSVLDSGLLIDGVFGFDLWVPDNSSSRDIYTALRVNYTLDGESEVSALYMFKFSPDFYDGWIPSPNPSIFPSPDTGNSDADNLITAVFPYLVAILLLLIFSFFVLFFCWPLV